MSQQSKSKSKNLYLSAESLFDDYCSEILSQGGYLDAADIHVNMSNKLDLMRLASYRLIKMTNSKVESCVHAYWSTHTLRNYFEMERYVIKNLCQWKKIDIICEFLSFGVGAFNKCPSVIKYFGLLNYSDLVEANYDIVRYLKSFHMFTRKNRTAIFKNQDYTYWQKVWDESSFSTNQYPIKIDFKSLYYAFERGNLGDDMNESKVIESVKKEFINEKQKSIRERILSLTQFSHNTNNTNLSQSTETCMKNYIFITEDLILQKHDKLHNIYMSLKSYIIQIAPYEDGFTQLHKKLISKFDIQSIQSFCVLLTCLTFYMADSGLLVLDNNNTILTADETVHTNLDDNSQTTDALKAKLLQSSLATFILDLDTDIVKAYITYISNILRKNPQFVKVSLAAEIDNNKPCITIDVVEFYEYISNDFIKAVKEVVNNINRCKTAVNAPTITVDRQLKLESIKKRKKNKNSNSNNNENKLSSLRITINNTTNGIFRKSNKIYEQLKILRNIHDLYQNIRVYAQLFKYSRKIDEQKIEILNITITIIKDVDHMSIVNTIKSLFSKFDIQYELIPGKSTSTDIAINDTSNADNSTSDDNNNDITTNNNTTSDNDNDNDNNATAVDNSNTTNIIKFTTTDTNNNEEVIIYPTTNISEGELKQIEEKCKILTMAAILCTRLMRIENLRSNVLLINPLPLDIHSTILSTSTQDIVSTLALTWKHSSLSPLEQLILSLMNIEQITKEKLQIECFELLSTGSFLQIMSRSEHLGTLCSTLSTILNLFSDHANSNNMSNNISNSDNNNSLINMTASMSYNFNDTITIWCDIFIELVDELLSLRMNDMAIFDMLCYLEIHLKERFQIQISNNTSYNTNTNTNNNRSQNVSYELLSGGLSFLQIVTELLKYSLTYFSSTNSTTNNTNSNKNSSLVNVSLDQKLAQLLKISFSSDENNNTTINNNNNDKHAVLTESGFIHDMVNSKLEIYKQMVCIIL